MPDNVPDSVILRTEIRPSLASVSTTEWDAVVGDGCPFFEYAFLRGLELSGCVGPGTGWFPRYVTAWRGDVLVGALALYRKEDSYGEFIFDWGWAEAAHRAGLPYYPKMVVAAPFSPVGGRRILVAPGEGDDTRRALVQAALKATVDEPATGLHWLYVTAEEADFLAAEGFAIRHTHQFQWRNEGYADFDAFLARFRSKRRHQIRRERRCVAEAGVKVSVYEGEQLTPEHEALAWGFYTSTVDKYFHGQRYLNRAFFKHLFAEFSDRLQLIVAEHEGVAIAGAVNVRKDDVMYGRYWGCSDAVPFLHFEVCSYAGIDAAIERGVTRFEAGAGGGGHKFGRGFLPTVTYSAHEILLPGLDQAVRDFVERERDSLAAELEHVDGKLLKPIKA